ncbi:hypothetical protein CUMW_157780 [Citrus unshiu]|nr:hypothetical protein CUMW_157780 [Citrus unshiu]
MTSDQTEPHFLSDPSFLELDTYFELDAYSSDSNANHSAVFDYIEPAKLCQFVISRPAKDSSGCLGCFIRPPVNTSASNLSKELGVPGRSAGKRSISEDFWTTSTCDMDNSAVQSQGSISSLGTNNLIPDTNGGSGSASAPSEFGLGINACSRYKFTILTEQRNLHASVNAGPCLSPLSAIWIGVLCQYVMFLPGVSKVMIPRQLERAFRDNNSKKSLVHVVSTYIVGNHLWIAYFFKAFLDDLARKEKLHRLRN